MRIRIRNSSVFSGGASASLAVLPLFVGTTVSANVGRTPQLPIQVPSGVSLERVRFLVVDPVTHRVLPDASIVIEDIHVGSNRQAVILRTGLTSPTTLFDAGRWSAIGLDPSTGGRRETLPIIVLAAGTTAFFQERQTIGNSTPTSGGPPIKDIYIKVSATRVQIHASQTSAGTTRTNSEISHFVNTAANSTAALTRGQSGVASDSNGQQHIRGEHADISFVVDGVPLPDTLSGRQGSVVVASTIQNLEILTGGFAPEFGGQTAAVLNIATLPGARKESNTLTLEGGNYGTVNGDLTSSGPLGKRASYVLNVSADRTRNGLEPQQPDNQTAHNAGSDQSYFAKILLTPARRDSIAFTISHAPSHLQLSNRTGLPARFVPSGQGYGFLGQRNADGKRPDVTPDNAGTLGADDLLLPSQQSAGQAISQSEVNEFGTLTWKHMLSTRDEAQIAAVVLHSGQDVFNSNPTVDLGALPVDNSVEYNPTANRSVYHYQFSGDVTSRRGAHQVKVGVLSDQQKGDESYQIIPASQLALDELAALGPNLAPAGAAQQDASGMDVHDVNGNPVFVPKIGAVSPVLKVHRSGTYQAGYVQDTWKTGRLTANYGVRYDHFTQAQNLGQAVIDKTEYSPRLNLSYSLAKQTVLRTSADHLFNIPPLAQGAVVGEPIKPESLNQYDVSLERQIARGQTVKGAYYYKQIQNQVDTGLFIPGSQIGLYSAVNFQFGGVHGVELSYDASPPGGVGLDGYLNYSYSIAKPNGFDNTGTHVPQFNDHDQRQTVGAGLAYLFKGGASTALTLNYGSGLASSPIPPSSNRIPRIEVDLRATTGPHVLAGHGGLALDVSNLFDDRSVINFQSAFSGTRFVQGRRVLISTFFNF
jgi:outer membrane receptor protein involved in Fe transport